MNYFKAISLGFDAMAMAEAILSKQPQMFSTAFLTLLSDVGDVANIKELDATFVTSISPEVQALTAKIFTHLSQPPAAAPVAETPA